jgi:4a-hydroxytetrahydrobiopterin dehydratase
MEIKTAEQLASKRCLPCEGGVEACSPRYIDEQLNQLDGWQLTPDGKRIRKDWRLKNFMQAIRFFNRIAEVAESEGHHPDLHLEGYRNVWIEIWTHAIGGLSENDFILAAKIDALDIA